MKRILKYLLLIFLSILLLSVAIFLGFYIKYRLTVKEKPGKLQVEFSPGELGKWVNPFIGTGGFPTYTSSDDIPGPTMPFGMVRLSPETKFFLGNHFFDEPTVSTAGYYYADRQIMGFSHTRLIGTGAYDGGHFRIFPSVGEGALKKYSEGKYHQFSHKNEIAFPGYYAVKFQKPGILAELTATQRTGIHRYTFSKNEVPHLIIDISNSLGLGKSDNGEVKIHPDNQEITGTIHTYGNFASRYGGQQIFFAARFDQPFKAFSVLKNEKDIVQEFKVIGDKLIADFSFQKTTPEMEIGLKLAISYVSVENAQENLEMETNGFDFNECVETAKKAWEEKLSLVKIDGSTEEQKQIFYTALYHSFQMPTIFTDANGDYKGFDKKIHKAEGFQYFTDMSLWDTFRTIHPLFTLLAPEAQRDMLVSLVKMVEQGGVLPRWPSGYGYTGSMLGASADIVIAESYLKGITDFDVEKAYQAMHDAALGINLSEKGYKPRNGIESYLKYHYCPSDLMGEAVSKTLEYCYADDAISKLANALGKVDDAKLFAAHSNYYKNIWNPETQYFQPRDTAGKFAEKFDPLLLTYFDSDGEFTDDYVEGCALQWRWALFFDAGGLISLFKSKDYFVNELNDFFEKSNPKRGHWNPGSYYWHGNEPDIHAAYLFNYAGRSDLTQKWVRWILENKYGAGYEGLDGDDDAGTLSAWYIFSSLGFYPVAGSEIYQIGTPLFQHAEIKVGDKTFTVIAENASGENKYVKKIWLNDKPLNRTWLKHDEIISGGTLRFEMGNQPERNLTNNE